MNITQTPTATNNRREYLDRKALEVISQYEKGATAERRAVIGHIDSFLPMEKGESKQFWLKIRQRLERINEL